MPSAKIVSTYQDLNSLGCEMLLATNESHVTRMTSSKMRWISLKNDKNEFISKNQKKVCDFISEITKSYGSADWSKLNAKILLYTNPIKEQSAHIKELLQAGADIRYVNHKETTKITINKNRLFIAFAEDTSKVVNSGLLYVGNSNEDPFIAFYKEKFDKVFNSSRKITLNKDKLVFYNKWYIQVCNDFKNLNSKNWLNLILGAILGAIIGYILSLFGLSSPA